MRVLVTGGAGFLGSHIAEGLLGHDHDVAVLDDLSGGAAGNVPPAASLWKNDICDAEAVDSVFAEVRPEIVFHCAAYPAEVLSHWIRRHNYTVNLLGSMNLLNASVKHAVDHFVFLSSIAVYGSRTPPFDETDVPQPEDPYGIAKYAVELDLEAAKKQFGLNYTVFRPHNVFGSRQNLNDAYRNVVAIFIRQALTHQPITIFGDGSQTRAFTYVKDIVPGICAAPFLDRAYSTYNAGSDGSCSVLELAHKIREICGSRSEIVHLPPRREVKEAWSRHERFKEKFPFHETELCRALQETIETVKVAGVPRKFEALELTEGLPEIWQH